MRLSKKLSEDFIRPFSLHTVSILRTLAEEMKVYGLTASDVIEICDKKLKDSFPEKPKSKKTKQNLHNICRCGSLLTVISVNKTKCTMIGGDATHMEICSNSECNHTRIYKEEV